MINKYIKITIFYSLIILLLWVLKVNALENTYTISGDYTYSEVLNALSDKTKRSVLGSTSALQLKRNFDIYEKRFSVAVDHVNKNLFTDGYVLFYDSLCFYIKPLTVQDTGKQDKKMESYQIYLPYSKRYLVTKDKQEYLNALQKDKESYMCDSITKYNLSKNYKLDIEILGFTDEKTFSKGFDVNDNISIDISKDLLNTVINMNLGISYNNYKINNSYNFYRNIVSFTNEDTSSLMFGQEERRISTHLTNDKIISDIYESIYNGINIKIFGNSYVFTYRTGIDQITIPGIIDSVSYCQYKIDDKKDIVRYRYIKNYKLKNNTFYLYIRVKKVMLYK